MGSPAKEPTAKQARVSLEIKTAATIVAILAVLYAVLGAYFLRQLSRQELMELGFGLSAAFALIVLVLDIWVYRPMNSLIRRSRRHLGARFESDDPKHRDEIYELDFLINTIIQSFTQAEDKEVVAESVKNDLVRLRTFNRQLVEVGDIGQEINAALPYRETVERALARAKAFLHADFVALILLEPKTRAFDIEGTLGIQAPATSADCCLYTADCPVRRAINGKAIVRSADHTCTLFPRTMRSQLIIPFQVEHIGEMALLATGTSNEHFEQVTTTVLQTLQGHLHSALSNAHKYDSIRRQVVTDHLTRLYNRRHFMHRAEEELQRSLRYQQPVTLLMVDIDHFKTLNDTYGHATGDRVLQAVATTMQQCVRSTDLCARMGGEEFAMLLPNTPGESAAFMAERLRRTMGEQRYTGLGLPSTVNITASVGVATCPRDATTLQELYELADKALYRAKAEGRDRVVQHGVAAETIFYD